MTKKSLLVTFSVSLDNWVPKMSDKFRLDRKIGFQNTFYTKCLNVIIDSIGPSIILRSIVIRDACMYHAQLSDVFRIFNSNQVTV